VAEAVSVSINRKKREEVTAPVALDMISFNLHNLLIPTPQIRRLKANEVK